MDSHLYVYNFLQSARLLAEDVIFLNDNCAADIAANEENISLKKACAALGLRTEAKYGEVFHPERMV